ncbi:MAG: TraR/DksA family transcriptional regulator [Planctomycetota bacterium]
MARKKTKKKPAPSKKTAKKTAARTAAGRKASARKAPARKTTAKKAASKKTTKKKTTGRQPARKPTTKKTTKKKTTKAPARKTARKAPARKTSSKKAPARKKTTKKTARKAPTKKTAKKTAKKAPAKKTTKKAAAKKTAKKTGKKTGRSRKTLGARSVAEAASAAKADRDGYVYINGRRVRMISTGGAGTVKKTRSRRPVAVEAEETTTAKPIKTKLTAKELRHYRGLLLLKRAELVGDVSAMEQTALEAGGNLSTLPIHMADIGSDTYDQDFNLGLAETERQRLREIDDALLRIQDKTYGVCQMTGKPIPKTRLNAKPWAKYTIEAARIMEGQWRP